MIRALQKEYRGSQLFQNLMRSVGDEVIEEIKEFEDTKAQMRVETATWGIGDLGTRIQIPVNERSRLDQRISFVLINNVSAGVTRIPMIKK